MTNQFIYNDGSRAHRGVWHLVEGEAAKTVVPEKVTAREQAIIDHHTDRCSTNERYWDSNKRTYVYGEECNCGHTGKQIGSYTDIRVDPEHVIWSAKEVACHQVGSLRTGGLKWNFPSYRMRHKDGETYTFVRGIEKPLFAEGDEFPAGPWCSRCQAKLDKRLADDAT